MFSIFPVAPRLSESSYNSSKNVSSMIPCSSDILDSSGRKFSSFGGLGSLGVLDSLGRKFSLSGGLDSLGVLVGSLGRLKLDEKWSFLAAIFVPGQYVVVL